MKTQKQINIRAYKAEGFAGRYQELVRSTVIPYQYEILNDRAGTEKSHVVKNFENAAKALNGDDIGDGFYGMVFQDSDAAKWLEAVAFSLSDYPDKELEERADELISKIRAAQDKDGYINTYYTIKDRDKRWTNLLEGHEMYCSGHLFEAGAAYYEATGKRELLDVCLKNAEHIYNRFVRDGKEGYPGHPEIELALMKLYRVSGDEHCLELAKHFVDVRGVDTEFYKKEKALRDWTVWGNNAEDNAYQQSAAPVRRQREATGHAVRAVYLYTAMADLAAETDDKELLDACDRLWDNITQKKMYVTGGIGATVHGEAFSVENDLPSDTAYSETCAAIGLMFFASRMLEAKPDARYADVMEQAFYNTVLAGMALDGKSFFYVNPLECVPGISGKAPTHRHDLTQRPGWYACACCPPNAARTIMSLGKYAYGESSDTAFCHLYAAGEVSFENGVKLRCETEYPFDMKVRYTVLSGGRLALRLPSWSRATRLSKNGSYAEYEEKNGYAYMSVYEGDVIELSLDEQARLVYAAERIPELSGKACVCRGPLVYCFEGVDNGGDVLSLRLKRDLIAKPCEAEGLNGITALSVNALRAKSRNDLYSFVAPELSKTDAKAIPYFCWANRGETQMRIWVPAVL